jgi:hypothetical protein
LTLENQKILTNFCKILNFLTKSTKLGLIITETIIAWFCFDYLWVYFGEQFGKMQTISLSVRSLSQIRSGLNKPIPNLRNLEEKIVNNRQQKFLSETIYQYLEVDSDNIFKQKYLDDNLSTNFQLIALAKLSGKTWQEISTELNIDIITLSNFFQDCCDKYANLTLQKLSQTQSFID